MRRKIFVTHIFIILIFVLSNVTLAARSFDFYLFGVKVESLSDYNWFEVTAGAVASVLVHELGHALYLERSGKDWELRSSSSGLAIYTEDYLSDTDCKNFGRAGFTLQTAVGSLLTTFEKTKRSDFTKGWIGMNTFQLHTYNFRSHNDGDDFQMIERGGGNPKLEQNFFIMLNQYNISRLTDKQTGLIIPDYGTRKKVRSHYWDDITNMDYPGIISSLNIDNFNQGKKADYASLYPDLDYSVPPINSQPAVSVSGKLKSEESSEEVKPVILSQDDFIDEFQKNEVIGMTAMLKKK